MRTAISGAVIVLCTLISFTIVIYAFGFDPPWVWWLR